MDLFCIGSDFRDIFCTNKRSAVSEKRFARQLVSEMKSGSFDRSCSCRDRCLWLEAAIYSPLKMPGNSLGSARGNIRCNMPDGDIPGNCQYTRLSPPFAMLSSWERNLFLALHTLGATTVTTIRHTAVSLWARSDQVQSRGLRSLRRGSLGA